MERLLIGIAAAVALCIAILMPAVGFIGGWRSQQAILQSEAEINARLASRLINDNPELWRVTVLRFEEMLKHRPGDGTPEARTLFDDGGELVAESADPLGLPLMERSIPVHDAGRPVGRLRIQRSMRPLLMQTAWQAALGVVLGGAVFFTLRTLPLRALRRSNEQLRHQATHDALTGLPNRVLFRDRLDQALQRARRTRRPLALAFVDLDRFKDINDSFGHHVGDEVLRHVAREIVRCLEEGWSKGRRIDDGGFTVGRMGGDEFVLMLESAGSMADTSSLIEQLQSELLRPQQFGGHTVHVPTSVGIAFHPADGDDADALLRHADMAMYRAKDQGRGTYQFFSRELSLGSQNRIETSQALRGALARGEFELHYQPKADLRSGAVVGVEALLRWRRPSAGLVPPGEFIELLESSQLIVPVGAWVIETACAQLRAWDALGLPSLTMAVNVSAQQFKRVELGAHIERVLQSSGIAPDRLELEVTESLLMEDHEQSLAVLRRIAALGVRLAIDDFGTGYSSLAYLKRFDVDTLKLDRTFVQGLPHDQDSASIAAAVLSLARSLGMEVVCEGVETAAQRDHLRAGGFDLVQGFFLARPMPGDAIPGWLQAHDPARAVHAAEAARPVRLVARQD